MDQKTIDELAKLGIIVIPLDHPDRVVEVHNRLAEILGEEHQLDYNEHKQNQEWTK